jgi:hypothetical protein
VVVAALLSNGFGEFTSVDPSVDVHVNVEFFWGVPKNESKDTTEGICLPVAHDEFPFFVANRAIGTREVSVVN